MNEPTATCKCEQVAAGRQEWGAFPTDLPPWLCKELAELPQPSTAPANPKLQRGSSPRPAVCSSSQRFPLFPLLVFHNWETKRSALRKAACRERFKCGELCHCVVTRTRGARPQPGPRNAPWTWSGGDGWLSMGEQKIRIWRPWRLLTEFKRMFLF